MSIFIFTAWYFPVGMYRNADSHHAAAGNGGTVLLFMWVYMMYMSTFAHMIQAGVELAAMAGNYANLLFMLTLIFCGYV
jgi:ATP-binding cassette subfamily G (WHITE) protein 2 (PDR)